MGNVPKAKRLAWQPKAKRKPSSHKNYYGSKAWRNRSKEFLAKNKICVWYGKRAKCTKYAKIADHVDWRNGADSELQPMCKSCSQAKTNMETANKKTGYKRTITPNGLR